MTRTIAILTSVHGAKDGNDLLLDQKALEGLEFYARCWPGEVIWMLAMKVEPPSYAARCDPASLPFSIIEVSEDRSDVASKLPAGALLVASADSFNDLDLAIRLPERVIYIIEYTLRTRIDIIRQSALPWYRAARRRVWERATERRRKAALAAAAGLQCNGLPSFERYKALSPNPMVFFDTRLVATDQIKPDRLAAKQARVKSGAPLRLAFSGRLNRMKGVHHILPLIDVLDSRGIDYVFEVFGDGDLAEMLRAKASDRLIVQGSVQFPDAWVNAMQDRVDLFVCTHPQGDPSCTYMEMLGCGVPIVGFANEAWTSMSALGNLGLTVPIGDVEALGDAIERLDRDRHKLADMMQASAQFSTDRSMEKTFEARLAHLGAIAEAT